MADRTPADAGCDGPTVEGRGDPDDTPPNLSSATAPGSLGPRAADDSSPSARRERALSSVADVSLALVLVAAAVAVLVGYHDTGDAYDPDRAAHTAETLGASTLDVTYSLEPVLETGSEHVDPVSEAAYDRADLQRATHGTSIGHVARAALADTRFPAGNGTVGRPFAVGGGYDETLDERLLVSLVGAQFATNVTAVWEPFDGSDIRGTATFGQPTPHGVDRSLVRTTVASEVPPARDRALAAVEQGEENESEAYAAVAAVVADAVVNGTVGDSQREMETDGVERAVAVSRYLRFADAVPGVSRDYSGATPGLDRSNVDAAGMDAALVEGLADRLTTALAETFDTPTAAASAVSTGEVTVSVTTWEP